MMPNVARALQEPNPARRTSDPSTALRDPLQAKALRDPLQRSVEIPTSVRGPMESSLGADLSSVRVHQGAHVPALGAAAFTQGNDVHFAPGRYDPSSASGRDLIGHELAHVVQQRAGRVQATGDVGGVPLNDSASLEAEADSAGRRAAEAVQQKALQRAVEDEEVGQAKALGDGPVQRMTDEDEA
jgi:hypothetical protein